MRQNKRELHELPHTEIVKSGTTVLDSPLGFNPASYKYTGAHPPCDNVKSEVGEIMSSVHVTNIEH